MSTKKVYAFDKIIHLEHDEKKRQRLSNFRSLLKLTPAGRAYWNTLQSLTQTHVVDDSGASAMLNEAFGELLKTFYGAHNYWCKNTPAGIIPHHGWKSGQKKRFTASR